MLPVGLDRWQGRAALVAVWTLLIAAAVAQQRPAPAPRAGEANVVEVVLEGNSTPLHKLPRFSTRAGQSFDPKLVEDDVRALSRTGRFIDIKPQYQRVPDGIVVIIQVVERPVIKSILYVGRKKASVKELSDKSGLKVGDAFDPHAIEDARRRIEDRYREKGFAKASVVVVDSSKTDKGEVVFLINESNRQRVWWTEFEGNTIATSARLRTQIQAKPGILWMLGGYVDPRKIEEDLDRLTAYYRRLGFFQAKVGRILEYDEDHEWLTIKYVINEGIRYKVRNVAVMGNDKFDAAEIQEKFEVKSGAFFNQDELEKDANGIRDLYGSQGYITVDVEVDTRFVEDPQQPGLVDLVYDIAEGSQYRVGRVKVTINGEYPHTRQRTIYNRLSLRPGDIVDTRMIRADEIRIKRSQLFENNPAKGQAPKISIVMPEGDEQLAGKPRRKPDEKSSPRSRSSFRGQSPDASVWQRNARGMVAQQSPQPPASNVWPAAPVKMSQPLTRTVVSTVRGSKAVPHVSQAAAKPIYRAQDPGYGGSAVGATGPDGRPASNYRQSLQSGLNSQGYAQTAASSGDAQYFDPRVTPANYQADTVSPGGPIAYPPPGGSVPPGGFAQNAPPSDSFAQAPGMANGFGPPPSQPSVFGAPPIADGGIAPDPNVGPITGNVVPGIVPPGGINYGVFPDPQLPTVDLDVSATEAQTGRLMFGVGVNSNAGLIGNIVLDEQNFDIRRWPSSWEDIRNGTAWRGAGQRFRLEAAPGTSVSRYVMSFSEPYLFDSPISFSTAASYYQRYFRDWREERVSGRFGLGYQFPFRPDISLTTGLRLEEVDISEPRVPTPPELAEVLGSTTVIGFRVGLVHDTRDSPFLPTEGFMTNYEFEQVVGSFSYPRFTAEASRYFTLHQRPDGSGRHVFKIGGEVGITGDDTPIYDNFFAGGFNTLRGFRFRGASPRTLGVIVGGQLMLLGTAEYMFPITADDMLRGVVFTDFGTVERDLDLHSENFRVAPGFGLRINVPALGPAPLAFDFAFPVLDAPGDENQVFAFFVGINR
jgi:outer membrane protein insertion porin family